MPTAPKMQPLFEGHREYQENQRGVSFEKLLLPYLSGSSQITITDPYIRQFHQARNLMELIEALAVVKDPADEVKVLLLTTESTDGAEKLPGSLEFLVRVKDIQAAAVAGITLDVKFDDSIHDRSIVANSGWRINLGRGLDIFQFVPNDAFDLAVKLQQYRQVRAFGVTYIHEEGAEAAVMKVRQIEIENFRGIRSGRVVFADNTLLVGGNNVGKSTVCEALDLLLGPERLNRRPVVDEHDFHRGLYVDEGRNSIPIVIRGVLIDLSDEALRRFGGHLRRWNDVDQTFVDELEDGADHSDEAGVVWALTVTFRARYDAAEDDFEADTSTSTRSLSPMSSMRIRRLRSARVATASPALTSDCAGSSFCGLSARGPGHSASSAVRSWTQSFACARRAPPRCGWRPSARCATSTRQSGQSPSWSFS